MWPPLGMLMCEILTKNSSSVSRKSVFHFSFEVIFSQLPFSL